MATIAGVGDATAFLRRPKARAAALASGPSDIESILRVVHEDQGNAEARNRTIEVTPEGAA